MAQPRVSRSLILGLVVIVFTPSFGIRAQDDEPESEFAWSAAELDGVEPDADRILREMGEYLRTARQFTFHAEITYDEVLGTGQKIQYGGVTHVAVRRPDRARTKYRGDLRRTEVYFDGKTFTLYDVDANVYSVTEVPADLDSAVDLVFEKHGFTVPIADLIYADPYGILIENVQSGHLVGRHKVDGTPCHQLAFTQEIIDWQIWIEDGPQRVPRKLLITYKSEPGSPQYTTKLSGWNFQPRLLDHFFEFHPPAGADEIEFIPNPRSEAGG